MLRVRRERQHGIANVWLVLTLGLLVAMTGLAVDTANMVWAGQKLQAAADAAAMAGARRVRTDEELTRAYAVYTAGGNTVGGESLVIDPNWSNDLNGDVVIGQYFRDSDTFSPGVGHINAVRVTARRTDVSLSGPLPTFFAQIMGIDSVNIQRSATAMIGGTTGAGIICLNPTDPQSLYLDGNVEVTVNNGEVWVNSDDLSAGTFEGRAVQLIAEAANIVGDYVTEGAPTLPDHVYTGVEPIPDPLAHVPEPVWNPADDLGTVFNPNQDMTLSPGYYSGGITANGGTTILEPGIYILDGAGLDLTGNARFFAEGCIFFITGTGVVNLRGNEEIVMSSPDPEIHDFPGADTYAGIGIFQSRTNTNDSEIVGTGLVDLEGTYYFPSNHVDLGGTGDQMGNQFVADTLHVYGNGNLNIDYDGRFPSPGHKVTLVQ